MKKLSAVALILLHLILFSTVVSALTPTKDFYINDFANIIDGQDEEEMLTKAKELAQFNGTQVVVVTTNSDYQKSFEEQVQETFDSFGIGQKKDNNGALLYIDMKNSKVRIETGDAFSVVLPDSKSGSYIDTYFSKEIEVGGLSHATKTLYLELVSLGTQVETIADGVSNSADNTENNKEFPLFIIVTVLVVIGVFLIFLFMAKESHLFGYDWEWVDIIFILLRVVLEIIFALINSGGGGSSSSGSKGGGGRSSGGGASRKF